MAIGHWAIGDHATHAALSWRPHPRPGLPSISVAFAHLFQVDVHGITPRASITIGSLVVPRGAYVPAELDLGGVRMRDLVGCLLEVDDSGPVLVIVGFYPA